MRRGIAWIVLFVALAAGAAAAQPTVTGTRPRCVTVYPQARMQAVGFDHLVAVTNQCEAPVTCRVSTDVNTTVQTVRVAVGATATVMTWLGSPASVFQARVDCETSR